MEIREKPQFCYYCGHKLSEGDRFCDQCGKEVVGYVEKHLRADCTDMEEEGFLNRANHLAKPLVPRRLAARFPNVMPVVFVIIYAAVFIAAIIILSNVLGRTTESYVSDGYYEDEYDYDDYDDDYYGDDDYGDYDDYSDYDDYDDYEY